jgi:predicted peptidase
MQTRHNDAGVDANGNLTAFSSTHVITGQSSSATGTPDTSVSATVNNVVFSGGYSASEIDHDSGDVLYIENRAPIQRATDQTENIKLVIEF